LVLNRARAVISDEIIRKGNSHLMGEEEMLKHLTNQNVHNNIIMYIGYGGFVC